MQESEDGVLQILRCVLECHNKNIHAVIRKGCVLLPLFVLICLFPVNLIIELLMDGLIKKNNPKYCPFLKTE